MQISAALCSCWPRLPLLEPSQFCQPREHWSSGKRGEEDCSRSDLILPCPVDSIGNQGKVRANLRKSELHLRARIDGTTSKFTQYWNQFMAQLQTLDPLSCHRDYYSLWICISPEDLFPPVLDLSFANTRECGGEEGLGLNDHLLLVHQAFIEPPPCIKHNAWSWRHRNEINTSLLMRCLKAI